MATGPQQAPKGCGEIRALIQSYTMQIEELIEKRGYWIEETRQGPQRVVNQSIATPLLGDCELTDNAAGYIDEALKVIEEVYRDAGWSEVHFEKLHTIRIRCPRTNEPYECQIITFRFAAPDQPTVEKEPPATTASTDLPKNLARKKRKAK